MLRAREAVLLAPEGGRPPSVSPHALNVIAIVDHEEDPGPRAKAREKAALFVTSKRMARPTRAKAKAEGKAKAKAEAKAKATAKAVAKAGARRVSQAAWPVIGGQPPPADAVEAAAEASQAEPPPADEVLPNNAAPSQPNLQGAVAMNRPGFLADPTVRCGECGTEVELLGNVTKRGKSPSTCAWQ